MSRRRWAAWRSANLLALTVGVFSTYARGQGIGASAGGNRQTMPTQNLPQQTLPTNQATAASPVEVTGRVIDGTNHQPIGRALVQFANRRVLTDHDGVFHLPEVTAATGSFRVSKPGFTAQNDDAAHRYSFPSATPIELLLYPEAILSGTVIDTAGETVPHVSVMARSSTYDESGHHWFPSRQAETWSDGSFRLPLAAGTYSLQVTANGRPVAGVDMLQSLRVPASPTKIDEGIRLGPGSQVHLDLRPALRRAYDVGLRIEHGTGRGFPMITARPVNGIAMTVAALPDRDDPGSFRVALPSGTYEVIAEMQTQDGRLQGRANVTVAGHDVSGVQLALAPSSSFPLVVEVDSSAVSDNATPVPKPEQLGLTLNSVPRPGEYDDPVFTVATRGPAGPAFSLPAGTYRLHARGGGAWYVSAASCGGTDLLQQSLTLSEGSGGAEIRVRVSNRTADLTGTVQLDGVPGSAWVYLVPTGPTAAPFVSLRSGLSGTFSRPYLAPGTYRVVALEHQTTGDLQNAALLNRLGGRVQTLTVNAGDHAALNLTAVPASELTP